MTSLHLIIPMGGSGSRFNEMGFCVPKPLICIYDHPFLYWSARSICKFVPDCDITFVVLKQHIKEFNISDVIHYYFPDANIVVIDHVLNGAVMTCLAGVEVVKDDVPILFNDCDHLFRCDPLAKIIRNPDAILDGYLLTFYSNSPNYSYVLCDSNGIVTKTREKEVISNDAICGAYAFRNKQVFIENATKYLNSCNYKEFYMSGVYNVMAANGLQSGVLRTDYHVSFGIPSEYNEAMKRMEYKDLL